MISHGTLKSLIHYDPETGLFTWLVDRSRQAKAGQVAGRQRPIDRYIAIKVCGQYFLAHILAHFYMTGKWPNGETDHINGVRDDNRWVNLRFVTRAQNLLNRKTYCTNTSGHKGVGWHSKLKKWRASIQLHGKRISLGCYETKAEAAEAYRQGEKIHYGEFARK
jgi:hypothetical protein